MHKCFFNHSEQCILISHCIIIQQPFFTLSNANNWKNLFFDFIPLIRFVLCIRNNIKYTMGSSSMHMKDRREMELYQHLL